MNFSIRRDRVSIARSKIANRPFIKPVCLILTLFSWVVCYERRLDAATATRSYFASSITSESMAALWVARERGFFNKHGLDVQFVLMPRSAVTIASLVAGEIDMAIVG